MISICNNAGTKLEYSGEVKSEIVHFLKKVEIVLDTLLQALPRRLSPSMYEDLSKHVSAEEIGDIFFCIEDTVRPLDWMVLMSCSYEKGWEIVGNSVVWGVKSFFLLR